MLTYAIKGGTANVSVVIRIIDATDGTPELGVVWNTSGIDMKYRREGAANVSITEATLAALTTAHADGGFLHIGNGYYRLDLPDAAVAAGVTGCLVHGIVTGMVVIGCYVEIVAYDPADTVRLGLTALPNAAADAAGGLPVSDVGGLDLDTKLANTNEVTVARMGALTDWINGGRLDLILDIIAADVVNLDGAAMRGTDSAATAANLATVDTVVDAIKAVTDVLPDSGALTTIGTDTARLTAVRAAVLTDWINGGRLDLLLDAIKAVTDLLSTNNAYLGPRGPGVFLDDGAANTNTVVGVDGIESNAVSTIAAATTIAGSLGIQRIYLVNDSVITLAQTYEGWEFIGIGQGNQITLGSQDVDKSCFIHLTLTGTQGGTSALWATDCSLVSLLAFEPIAQGCYLSGNNTIRASSLIIFDQCLSAVPGDTTPELTFSGGTSNVNFRHYSGGLQLNSMGTGDTMSYESDGQIIVDATCTDGVLTVRGNCDVTDNASGAVTITQSAAVNQANINAEVDAALDTAVPGSSTSDSINDRVKRTTDPVLVAQAVTGTLSTTQMTTDLPNSIANDVYNDRVITFLGNVTAELAGQQTEITDYDEAAGQLVTMTAVTTAPQNGDDFTVH